MELHTKLTARKRARAFMEAERAFLIDRYRKSATEKPPAGQLDPVTWYISLSQQWSIVHLSELAAMPPGDLLDVGAYYGLISGAAYRMGYRVSAVDIVPPPEYSSLSVPGRNVRLGVANACVDPLPFEDASFDVVVLAEVLEHLMYSPLLLFREIKRVLRPGGTLLLSTPQPASVGKLISLARGNNPIEPPLWSITMENVEYEYKGKTFLRNQRESKIWTAKELQVALRRAGLSAVSTYYYANTVAEPTDSIRVRAKYSLATAATSLFPRSWLVGGGMFVKATPISDA